MKELGVITIEGWLDSPAHENFWVNGQSCDVMWFRCPNPEHDHLMEIRVSEKNSSHGSPAVWKLTRENEGVVSISPSILCHDDFHCGIPTYFKLVDQKRIFQDAIPDGYTFKESKPEEINIQSQSNKGATIMTRLFLGFEPIELTEVSIEGKTLSYTLNDEKEAIGEEIPATPATKVIFPFDRAFADESNGQLNFFASNGEQRQVQTDDKQLLRTLVKAIS